MSPLVLLVALAPSAKGSMGTISFRVTGNRACNAKFTEGMLALHSFMYYRAHDAFQAAVKADASCAMARWGDAMAYIHPIWGEEELDLARAALSSVTNAAKLTAKEQAFLGAARALTGEGDPKARLSKWLRSTGEMRASFPKDDEVLLQHALALISNSERLTNSKRLMQSAAISMDVFRRHPDHPGAVHYLIHACDTTSHAILALPAAEAYARLAPSASHALHMPSHIFVHLGMWQEAARSNEASYAASEREDDERKAGADDRDWHSYAWLVAAYLELGQVEKAEAMIDALSDRIEKGDGMEMRFAYSMIARLYLSATGRWDRAEELLAPILKPIPLEQGEGSGSLGCALHAPGGPMKTRLPMGLLASVRAAETLAEAAMRRGDPDAVTRALSRIKDLWAAMAPWGSMVNANVRERQVRLEVALLSWAKAKSAKTTPAWDDAVRLLEKVLEIPETPSGPAFDPPARLLLAEALAEAGRGDAALATYEALMAERPNLSRAMLGAARTAKAHGNVDRSSELYRALAVQWSSGDAGDPTVIEATQR